jgi:hypothetical protein
MYTPGYFMVKWMEFEWFVKLSMSMSSKIEIKILKESKRFWELLAEYNKQMFSGQCVHEVEMIPVFGMELSDQIFRIISLGGENLKLARRVARVRRNSSMEMIDKMDGFWVSEMDSDWTDDCFSQGNYYVELLG